MYMDFACCAGVPGGGRNKEYALHLLHLCKGNVQVCHRMCIKNIFNNKLLCFIGSNAEINATYAISPTRTSFNEIRIHGIGSLDSK